VIKLVRSRNAAQIHPSFTGDGLFVKMLELAKTRLAHQDDIAWEGVLGDWKKMKPTLKLESFDKCAYCEASTAVVAHGDVEHFRPKSVYWWLALCVDNYVYACQLCNQTHKSDKFPTAGPMLTSPALPNPLPTSKQKLRTLVASLCPDPATVNENKLAQKWAREKPSLIHPYLEDPEPLLAWNASETAREVHLIAPDGASDRSKRAVAGAVDCLGLNRETLTRSRYMVYSALKTAVRGWKNGDNESLEQIRLMCAGDHPFAGMCRYFSRLAGAPV
jgi:hypothetical protein